MLYSVPFCSVPFYCYSEKEEIPEGYSILHSASRKAERAPRMGMEVTASPSLLA